ncbi:hypothetical protein ABT320_01455 [Streptomyces cellulosae]
MAERLVRFLSCDKPGCTARFVHGTERHLTPPTVLRHEAHAAGWTTDNGDYCPTHQGWPGFTAWALPSRRTYLHAALQAAGTPVTTEGAVQLLDGSPYAAGRNTIRKQLRGLARSGLLTVTTRDGRTTYHLIHSTGDQ